MIPDSVIDELDGGDLAVYVKLLRASLPFASTATIADKSTGEVLHEVPLGAREVFVSREQIGRWWNSAPQANHEETGRRCVRRLQGRGFVEVRQTAQRAKRGYSRDVLLLPMAEVHLQGRSGKPDPSVDRVDTARNPTAENVCNDPDAVEVARTDEAPAVCADGRTYPDAASGTPTLSRFAEDRVNVGPNCSSETDPDALIENYGQHSSGAYRSKHPVVGEAPVGREAPCEPEESTPTMERPEPAPFIPRVAPTRPDGTPWTPEQRATLEANVAKVRSLPGVLRELPDVGVEEEAA
jgi:hypothetical protein